MANFSSSMHLLLKKVTSTRMKNIENETVEYTTPPYVSLMWKAM